MLIPAVLLNLAVVALFLTTVSFSGLMIWRESKNPQNTTTVRPTTKPTRPGPTPPPGPTIYPPTRPPGPTPPPGPTIYPPTRPPGPTPPPGPTIYPPTRPPGPTPPPGPTVSPPPPGPTTSPPFPTPSPHYKPWFPDPQEKIDPEKILNRTVRRALNPCNDFYFFACGEEKVSTPEKESTPSMETDDNIVLTKTMIEKKYNDILGKPETAEDIAPLKLAKQLYNQCDEKKPGDSNELQELITKFERLRILADSKAVLKSFYETALDNGYLPKSLFIIDMVTDKESNRYVYIRKPSPESNFYGWPLDTTSLRVDTKELENALKKEKNAANYEKYIQPGYETEEKDIANVYSSEFEPEPYEATIQTFGITVDGFPLVDIIRKTFSPSLINDDQIIRVECLACLRNVLAMSVVNNKESLLTYLIRHALADNLLDTSEQAVEDWIKERFGTTEPIKRYKALFCSSKTVSLFKKAMDYAYIKNYVDPKKNALIDEIVQFSKTSLKNLVQTSSGLEEPKKEKFNKIIETFKVYTPLHGDLNISKDVTDYYSGLQLDAASYCKSLEIVRKFVMDRAAKRFRLIDGFNVPIQAYKFMFGEKFMRYDRDVNSAYLSVNALQDMFLSPDRSAFLNFGGFGSIIGYALSQSVISKVIKEADKKNLVQSVYLGIPADAAGNKDNFTECYVNAYKKHSYPSANETDMLNKKQEKAIVYESDGVQVAYFAYKDFLGAKNDTVLPSFVNFTDGAMFYISYANMARARDPLLIKEEDYIRAYAKVNVMAKTSKEFDREFKCDGIAIDKCNVWLKGSSKKAKLREHFDLFMR
ncbi:neprilysin-1-like [Planococcus citri]|uniref:neprilysin-1-like n=1 Tax=Planococcus citri TaxID=170843 RepID=UPI0031F93200